MTVKYDGKLIRNTAPVAIDPCCEALHRAVMFNTVKVNKTRMYITIEGRASELRFCPFCGAEARTT